MELSFVIPIKNEGESLSTLVNEIDRICKLISKSYEIIFVDDGSTDNSVKTIKAIKSKNKNVRCLRLRNNFGKAIALSVGFEAARGKIVFSMDGDLQDNPQEIPNFIEKLDEGYDLVNGWKKKRNDPISKVLPSRIINLSIHLLTGLTIHDVNCGFKAYRKEVVKNLNIYGDLYRFIPILVNKQGYRITEISVKHRERKFGKSKYGWKRFVSGFLDLLTVFFITRYTRRPGHFFGTFGFAFLLFGTAIGAYITYLRLTTGSIQYRYPLLFLGVLLIVLGVQFIMTGLLAEMVIHFNHKEDVSKLVIEKF